MEKKRLFIAFELDDECKEYFDGVKNNIIHQQIRGNYVPRENAHITISFLGDTDVNLIGEIEECIKDVNNKGNITVVFDKVELKKRKDEFMAWISIDSNETLYRIHDELYYNLGRSGFEFEKRFNPHITIARRLKGKPNLEEITYKTNIENIVLYESVLKENGPIYNVLFRHQIV